MTTEKRAHPRVKTSNEATFTTSNGTSRKGMVHDLGRGGLFIATDAESVVVGKLIDIEITTGDGGVIATTGRVIWARKAGLGDLRAGIGVKFIELEDAELAMVDGLIGQQRNVRERTVLGIAAPPAPAPPSSLATSPAREKTTLGIAPEAPSPPRPSAPRERTVLGIGIPVAPVALSTEPSIERELSWAEPAAAPQPVAKTDPDPIVAPVPVADPIPVADPVPVADPIPVADPVADPIAVAAPVADPIVVADPAPVSVPAPDPSPGPVQAKAAPVEKVKVREPSEISRVAGVPKRQWVAPLIVIIVAGSAGAAFFNWSRLFPPEPAPDPIATVAPTPSAQVDAAPNVDAAPEAAAATAIESTDASVGDAHADARAVDASIDVAAKDASIRDAATDAGSPHVKVTPPKPKTTSDDPY